MVKKDFSAVKFQVAEALGEWMDCLYLKGVEGDNENEFHSTFIHHSKADGMSGIKRILVEEGHHLKKLPGLKSQSEPFFKLPSLFKYIKLTKKVEQNWLFPRIDQTGIPKHFVLARLQKDKVKNLHEKAKKQGVSLNAQLICALDMATKNCLLTSDSERKWILPLNMRPEDKALEIEGNYSASIVLNLLGKKHYTSSDFHQMIKSYLKNHLHWGSFIYSNMARFIGFKGTLKVARSIKEVGTGVFSNLGNWPKDFVELNDHVTKWRAVVAPSTQILPVAATAWQWEDTLSLTLQLHPSLGLEQAGQHHMSTKLMREWLSLLGVETDHCQEVHWSQFPNAPKTT